METVRDSEEALAPLESDVRSQETSVRSQEKNGGLLGKLRRRSSSASTTPVKVSWVRQT